MLLTIAYLINRTPSALLKCKTPYELLFVKLPFYSHIKSFCCLAYVHDHDLPKDKLRARSRTFVFLGYPFGKKGWRLYDLESKKIILSRDVFYESSLM